MKPALLVIDMQNAYYELPQIRPSMDWAKPFISQAAELFHKHNFPVFYIQIDSAGEGPGSPGFGLIEGIGKTEKDFCLTKSYKNSFWETSLEKDLRNMECSFLVIAGFAAGQCINMTYGAAQERGFGAAILQHGIAGWKEKHIEVAHEQCSVVSVSALTSLFALSK